MEFPSKISVNRKINSFCRQTKYKHLFFISLSILNSFFPGFWYKQVCCFEIHFNCWKYFTFSTRKVLARISYPVRFRLLMEYYCQVLLKICPGMSDWKLLWAEHSWIGTYSCALLEAKVWKFGHRDTHYLETRRQPVSTQNYWYELSCHSSQMAYIWRFIVFHTSPMFLALYNKQKKKTWSCPCFSWKSVFETACHIQGCPPDYIACHLRMLVNFLFYSCF